MKCSETKNYFLDFLDNKLDKNIKEAFTVHINKCEKCSNELKQFSLLNKKLTCVKNIKTPQSLTDDLFSYFNSKSRKLTNEIFRYENLSSIYKIAASIVLFIAGSVFGFFISNSSKVSSRIANLEMEISQLKESLIVATFNEHTISQRIKAVNYLEDQKEINPSLINALANALNYDENVNVRIMAVKSLFRYTNNPEVRGIMIKSLVNQNEPLVQILIIDYLVTTNDKEAVKNLKMLIDSDNTNSIVKQYASRSLKTLL